MGHPGKICCRVRGGCSVSKLGMERGSAHYEQSVPHLRIPALTASFKIKGGREGHPESSKSSLACIQAVTVAASIRSKFAQHGVS